MPQILGHHRLSHLELAGPCALVVMGFLCALLDLHMVFDIWPQQIKSGANVPVQEEGRGGNPCGGVGDCPIG